MDADQKWPPLPGPGVASAKGLADSCMSVRTPFLLSMFADSVPTTSGRQRPMQAARS